MIFQIADNICTNYFRVFSSIICRSICFNCYRELFRELIKHTL